MNDSVENKKNKLIPKKTNSVANNFINKIFFSEKEQWLKAHAKFAPIKVQSAVLKAFRRASFASIFDAAEMCGVSASSWNSWENNAKKMADKSKKKLIESGYFAEEHFGQSPLNFCVLKRLESNEE